MRIAGSGGGLLREGFPRRLGAGMAVSLAGAIVVGIAESGGGRTPVIGVVLCVAAAVCYAAGGSRPAGRGTFHSPTGQRSLSYITVSLLCPDPL